MSLDVPTIPIFKLLPGRPNKAFFSGAAAFFGGILFLIRRVQEELKDEDKGGKVLQACNLQLATKLMSIHPLTPCKIIERPIDYRSLDLHIDEQKSFYV